MGHESGHMLAGSSVNDSPSSQPSVNWAMFLSGGCTREESSSKLTQVVGRINFLVAMERRNPASC